ncbi:MAG: alpha/beta fold hydrolase [bacterium]|nr:alpha/beta fold hydrolase [bacterium]
MLKKIGYWVHDYLHAIHKQSYAFIYRKPLTHYLGFIEEGKSPIILIPGIYEKWHFLKAVADPLSRLGHPVYILEHLGYNINSIQDSAKLIRELIDEKKLEKVIIIAHSKGGLIGKYLLAFDNKDNKINKLITIASPFGGTNLVKMISHKSLKELRPDSEIIKRLQEENGVNSKIVSIYGTFDNHIWPESSCVLDSAKNIQVNEYGHHKILFSSEVKNIVLQEVEKI